MKSDPGFTGPAASAEPCATACGSSANPEAAAAPAPFKKPRRPTVVFAMDVPLSREIVFRDVGRDRFPIDDLRRALISRAVLGNPAVRQRILHRLRARAFCFPNRQIFGLDARAA